MLGDDESGELRVGSAGEGSGEGRSLLRSVLYLALGAAAALACGSASLKSGGSGGSGGSIVITGSAGAGGTGGAGAASGQDGGSVITVVGGLVSVGWPLASAGGAITVTDDGFELGGASCNDAGTICGTGAITP